ncbi:MAG: hypothetical protein IPK32_10985 [Verrucomicrobiaceae bacterium]|nr:hypothetical protein [Verrucomicrobiaceae bacterium]
MIRTTVTFRDELPLKDGDRADLRVVMENGVLIVTQITNHVKAGAPAADYQARLGQWNRK